MYDIKCRAVQPLKYALMVIKCPVKHNACGSTPAHKIYVLRDLYVALLLYSLAIVEYYVTKCVKPSQLRLSKSTPAYQKV